MTAMPMSEDIVEVLQAQHERIRSMFELLMTSADGERQHLFDDLRAFLAVHEAAEEMVLRPATRKHHAESIADARNAEEKRAATLLADLEDQGTDSAEFLMGLAELRVAVEEHALMEERTELPRIVAEADMEERAMLGRRLIQAEKLAPTHAHPTTTGSTAATMLVGPFASMLDRVKDALGGQSAPHVEREEGSPWAE